MKRTILILLIAILTLQLFSCKNKNLIDDRDDTENQNNIRDVETQQPNGNGHTDKAQDMYQNPIIKVNDQNTWSNYGVGDPFVMRYNGRYYLYCSTKDGQIGIQCWSSDNLTNWSYEGLCANEELTVSAYAPEVVYYNGNFYMYTSPAGAGHYVLKSDSPTGPFYAITENFGLSIDGNVFIDDDGSWYFYCAADGGIMVYPMSAPDKVDTSAGKKISCDMNGWTEGSMVVKYNGKYYITYAGNHVWSSGYRINYAVSADSPLEFKPASNNPLLLSTDTNTVMGIGHSSTVVGPNLDEYFIVYHSHKSVPNRDMNIDRIIFNGENTVVLGPTTEKQQAPQMPDLYCRFEKEAELSNWNVVNGKFKDSAFVLSEGGKVLSKEIFDSDYTVEYNFKTLSDESGIFFGYRDESNYGKVVYFADKEELEIEFVVKGNTIKRNMAIEMSFGESLNKDTLNVFSVRKSENEYAFFVNGRELFKFESELLGGSIGVFCDKGEAIVGFVGATDGSLQSTVKDVYKPIESAIPAVSCTQNNMRIKKYVDVNYLNMLEKEKYEYKINVDKSGNYDLIIEYRSIDPSVLEVYQDDIKIGEVILPITNGQLLRIVERDLNLQEGMGKVTFCVKKGKADVLSFLFHKSQEVPTKQYDFKNISDITYSNGAWSCNNGVLTLKDKYGKIMFGSENWGDYIVESEITPTSDNINIGLCVRVSNPANSEESSKQYWLGSDYLQGYFVGFGNGSIVLGKHNYNWQELKRVEFNVQKGKTYHLKVEVEQNALRISVDGNLVISYTDAESPFLHGMIGYRVHDASISVSSLDVRPYLS